MAENVDLIIEERLIEPSKVTPTLFLGLGGCGTSIVQRVKQHLQRRPDYEELYNKLTKFAAMDTNINDLENVRKDMDDVFLLSDFEKQDYAKLANGQLFLDPDEYFTQWVPEDYRFRAGDTAGAGQIRIESRLGLYYQTKHRDLLARFRHLLEQLKDHQLGHRRLDSNELRIVVCYSIAGGTGSGAHLPIAYMLRDIARQLGKPRLFGVSVLPSVFEDKTGRNKDGIFANGYAALKELEHLMKLGAPEAINYPNDGIVFHYNPADTTRTTVQQQPFEFVYMIDRPEEFYVKDVVKAAADGLYLQMFTPIFAAQAGDYDNYTQHQRFLVPHGFEKKGVKGFTSYYGSYGSAVMLVPTNELINFCAKSTALNILRNSFVTQVPVGSQYDHVREMIETFNEAKFTNENGEMQSVAYKDLEMLTESNRKLAMRGLFERRVRLLAYADYAQRENLVKREYLEIWRHGHGASFASPPLDSTDFGTLITTDERGNPTAPRKSYHIKDSIVGAVENSIGAWPLTSGHASAGTPQSPAGQPSLLREALRHYRKRCEEIATKRTTQESLENSGAGASGLIARDIDNEVDYAKAWMNHPKSRLFQGLDAFTTLSFMLDDDAAGIDLRAQRYAFIQLLRHPSLEWARQHVSKPRPDNTVASPELEDTELKKGIFRDNSDDVNQALANNKSRLNSYAEELTKEGEKKIEYYFATKLVEMYYAFEKYENELATLETGFDEIERRVDRQLKQMRQSGDAETNQFVLDGEALQMENGRRLWDFYYEDKWAAHPSFRIDNPEISHRIAHRFVFRLREGAGSGNGSQALQAIIEDIEKYARTVLEPVIAGVPGHQDSMIRNGYTLDQALRDEIRYRALHLSNQSTDPTKERQRIASALGRFSALTEDERTDLVGLDVSKNRDYLRDKMRRIVSERANLLCYYDDSRDQQGGVRPCRVLLGSMHPEFGNSEIGALIKENALTPNDDIQWLEDPTNGLRQLVFYRAVLNVPLYVFGRMSEMQADYHGFRDMAVRPKVLHIDKNWEGSNLSDLDPEAAIEFQRAAILRREIVGFATLFTAHRVLRGQDPIITHLPNQGLNDESYWILRPAADPGGAPVSTEARTDMGSELEERGRYQKLGKDLREAIAMLPHVLHDNPIAYRPYQMLINGVRNGEAPIVLKEVCKQVVTWRRQHDGRRERYGRSPNELQKSRLADLHEAYNRLAQALEDLHRLLGETYDEFASTDGMNRTQGAQEHNILQSINDSVAQLERFRQIWAAINNPEEARSRDNVFGSLFGPLRTETALAPKDANAPK